MKQKSTRLIPAIFFAMLLMMQPYASMARNEPGGNPNGKEKEKTIGKTPKLVVSRNNSSVKIYPDIVKRVMHVVAKDDNDGQGIDFFVFGIGGKLIQHFKMKSGDHEKLTGLERGRYIFRVFSGDEETATGNLDIR